MNCDYNSFMVEYHDLPFDKYFLSHDFKRFNLIKRTSLHDLVEFYRSTSCYQLLRSQNLDRIENGKMPDPLLQFALQILQREGLIDKDFKLDDFGKSQETTKLMQNVKFDMLWTFFVHLLHN